MKDLWVIIISMMVLCNDIVSIEYERRRSGLPSAPLDMEYDINRTKE
tara:strand:+ start:13 stop:153 length:141 start_codon:yes stop_codon:yes gene_type:complete